MRKFRLPDTLLVCGVLCGVLCGALLTAPSASAQAGITVQGNQFVKDGSVWVPKGFTLVSFVAPEGHEMNDYFKAARPSFGAALLNRAKSLGADVLRYQVSQVGLDERSSIYDAKYLGQIEDAVRQSRALGFAVILSMQWEAPSGLKNQPAMPADITQRAWARLAPVFANDPYVMLELFNEPGMWETTAGHWNIWQSGMQSLVNVVRAAGASNLLLLDGLRGSHYLKDAPPISDPLRKLAYAVHPYIDDRDHGAADWNRDFGNFARTYPVLTTEWNATSILNCRPDIPQVSREFLDYLKERRIGLILWALDLHGTIFDNQDNPMGFRDFECGKWGTGAAYLSLKYFKNE